ncbi:methyltransferase domain-containing protein [Altererythrobacter aurantiacus]|uniref:protein-glutamate O-methyltransferase n=1 Tax=Parapontixanthobacter aurantiacus TaxID=1463599 RepID=A0A844ZBW9_9SPHN|nr:protein-glutamate O-methyltransferase CheR [Parapontixanthobacter aurantiacus]MXO84517.1 methyltransferase domain-containing protein [Parapontixanthobacter aurantiacus]
MEISAASQDYIRDLLETHTGQQITDERRWRITTALAGIFREYGISNVDQLVCLLTMPGQAQLAQRVVEALLNNETYFFRDFPYFETLKNTVLPELRERRADSRRLRVWSAGCSTGQEALSLAMIFSEQAEDWRDWTIEIIGSDVSRKAIETAKAATYSQFEIQRGISVAQMLKFFSESEQGWQADPKLRSMTQFHVANLLEAPGPALPYDIVLCRNVLLYFEAATRARAFERIHHSLAADGWLMLGAGETALGQTSLFEPAQCGNALYRHSCEAVTRRRGTPRSKAA